jgi:hypothetical protein
MENNIQCSKRNSFNDFTNIDEIMIDLRNNYKILYVDYLDSDLVHAEMYDRKTFVSSKKYISWIKLS